MASKEQDSPSGVSTTSPSKGKLVKCIVCQVNKEDILRKGKGSSIDTLNRALNLRKDEVYVRVHKDVPNFSNQDIFWHSTCYFSYTSEHSIRDATSIHESKVVCGAGNEETRRVSRSSAGVYIDWFKCFIWRTKTNKKCREMHNVCSGAPACGVEWSPTRQAKECQIFPWHFYLLCQQTIREVDQCFKIGFN